MGFTVVFPCLPSSFLLLHYYPFFSFPSDMYTHIAILIFPNILTTIPIVKTSSYCRKTHCHKICIISFELLQRHLYCHLTSLFFPWTNKGLAINQFYKYVVSAVLSPMKLCCLQQPGNVQFSFFTFFVFWHICQVLFQ